MKKPQVFLIRIQDNPVSMWESGRSYQTWRSAGYNVALFDAITPKTYLDSEIKLTFKKHWRGREFTETEKAVFYSHLSVLSLARRKSGPSIVIEHDAHLVKDLDLKKMEKEDIDVAALGMCVRGNNKYQVPCLAYFINPALAGFFYDDMQMKDITKNIDGYFSEFIASYGKGLREEYSEHVLACEEFRYELGTTIDHGNDKHLPNMFHENMFDT